jgi:hypothetical protein
MAASVMPMVTSIAGTSSPISGSTTKSHILHPQRHSAQKADAERRLPAQPGRSRQPRRTDQRGDHQPQRNASGRDQQRLAHGPEHGQSAD